MNALQRIFYVLFNKYQSNPGPTSINRTGIVCSDHPVLGNGWIKGWVVNVPSKDIIIVCNHSNPSTNTPSNKIYVVDKFGTKIERTIVALTCDKYTISNDREESLTRYRGGDIAICKVDTPFPDTVKAYNFSIEDDALGKIAVTFDQHGRVSMSRIHYGNKTAWIFGKDRDPFLIPGDSGTPWFIWENDEWRVITHTTVGSFGEGPYYCRILKDIKAKIDSL